MRIAFHRLAKRDLEDAAAFYEEKGSAALAARFVGEFKRLTVLLLENPGIGAPRARDRRSVSMSVFPYTIIYRVVSDEIRVLVVKHDKRRPSYGERR